MENDEAENPRHAKLHTIWLALLGLVEVSIVIEGFPGSAKLLLAVWIGSIHGGSFLGVGILVTLLYAAMAALAIVGIFAFPIRLRFRIMMVLAPLAFAAVTHVAARGAALPGAAGPPPPAVPFAGCTRSTADPAERGRACTMDAADPNDRQRGDCPAGYTCREPVMGGPTRCFVGCYNDCMCPAPSTCVNAGCRWPGDPLP